MDRDKESLGALQFLTGPLAGNTYPITNDVTSLGRETANDIVIPDPTVSRYHAQIIWENGSWTIKQLAMRNRLTVNKHVLAKATLNDQDTISLGAATNFLFLLTSNQSPQENTLPRANSVHLSTPARDVPGSRVTDPTSALQDIEVVSCPRIDIASVITASLPLDTPLSSIPPVQSSPANVVQSGIQEKVQTKRASTISKDGIQKQVRTERAPAIDKDSIQEQVRTDRAPAIGKDGEFAHPTGSPWLEVSTNTDQDKQVYPLIPDCQAFDIGRDPSNTIVINRPTVSAFHAQIIREGSQLVLIHPHPSRTQTLNGLTYQGMTIRGDEQFRHTLVRGDIFRVSDDNGAFVTLTYNDGSGMAQEILPESRPIPLGSSVITLGRAPDNTVILKHPLVSGHHARLEQVADGYCIIDTNSTNHVYVNGQRIHTYDLQPGDEIRIGPFKLTYTGTELTRHDESGSIRIDALHLKRTGNNNIVLLNDVSLAIPPRKFVAVVGGSGAGKSTLMNALNGMRPAQSGAVLYNGQNYYRHLAAFSTQLGYVPQDDIIHRDLSVERALYYAAKLRLPKDFTAKQIKERIDEVLDDVEIKHRRYLLISKLSGGQRKRVSIALELLAKPSVFFLDEPTSGLDPGLDRKMMLLLRKLADKGHTIVLVTHATNNINACDYVCFLCQGGRLAYYGPPSEAKDYFGKSDFAEIYTALEPTKESPNAPAEAEARFQQSLDYQRYVVEPLQQDPLGQTKALVQKARIKPPKRGNPWKQFVLLSMRYLELILNDRLNLAILVLQAPIIGLILYFLMLHGTFDPNNIATCYAHQPITAKAGPLFPMNCQTVVDQIKAAHAPNPDQILNDAVKNGRGGQKAEKILFIMAFAVIMFGCLNGAREIVKEAPIYQRERTVNLGIAPYLFSKIFVLGMFSLLQCVILIFLVNLKDSFNQLHSILFPPLLEIYISMALTALAGLMTGLLVSSIVSSNDQAMSLVPLPLIPQVIFAGVLFSLDNPPSLQGLGAIFTARWSMAAMGSTAGLHGDALDVDGFSFVGTLFTHINPQVGYKAAADHLLFCWGVLGFMILAQALLIACFLKRKDVRR